MDRFIMFGPWKLHLEEIFFVSKYCFAIVNTKPVVSGHILVVTKKVHERFSDLSPAEVCDLWTTAQLIGRKIEKMYDASSLTFVIQDGKEAGQTVPHTHIHILPRKAGDFSVNDDIYDHLERKRVDLNKKARSLEEMKIEADILYEQLKDESLALPTQSWNGSDTI